MAVLAFLPPKVVRTYQPRRVGGGAAGRRVGGALGGRLAPPKPPGKGGPYNPVLPAPTPFQPGANPAPLLGAWAMLGLGIGVGLKVVWDWINYKAKPLSLGWKEGFVTVPGNATWRVSVSSSGPSVQPSWCPGYEQAGPPAVFAAFTTNPIIYQGIGVGVRIGTLTQSTAYTCGGGSGYTRTDEPGVVIENAAGGGVAAGAWTYDWSGPGGATSWSRVTTFKVESIERNGVRLDAPVTPVPLAPGTQPLVAPNQLPATAPEPFRLPAPAPAPSPLPATVPNSTPAPAPAPAPGGLPATAPATAPAPTTVPTVTTTITRVTPGSQPQTLTATGVTTAPAPAPITQTPAQAVLIGTALIGGPGAAPPPGPAGTAAELGRIEKKMELALDRINPLEGLVDALELLGALLNLLEEPSPGGSYSIRPACGTDAHGAPLPVIEVPIAGGLGVVGAIVPRLDAIAELLDLHKQLRQPVCKGKPTGDPVTVTGVEID